MSGFPKDLLREIWYRALKCEIGYAVATKVEDKRRLQSDLYEVRKSLDDPALEALMICLPAKPDTELWLCKKAVEL